MPDVLLIALLTGLCNYDFQPTLISHGLAENSE